jgi:hypothetical protein
MYFIFGEVSPKGNIVSNVTTARLDPAYPALAR